MSCLQLKYWFRLFRFQLSLQAIGGGNILLDIPATDSDLNVYSFSCTFVSD